MTGPDPGRAALLRDAVRNARLSQAAGRLRRLVPPRLLGAGLPSRAGPDPMPFARGLGVDTAPQWGPPSPPEETGAFAAYGTERRPGDEAFWSDRRDGLLFLFHLHGFAPLAAYAAAGPRSAGDRFWIGVIEDWLDRHPTPDRLAWHPHPLSNRLVAWSAALSSLPGWPPVLRRRTTGELLRQGRFLRRAVEHDVGGNHVLRNATALVFAGTVASAADLREAGLRLLRGQLPRQLLADGGHEERSTSYHRAIAQDLAEVDELLARAGMSAPEWLTSSRQRAERWQRTMAGPDGRLPLLNDAWEGPPLDSPDHGQALDPSGSGYIVLRDRDDQLIFDAGPLCPPHLPPHAHADALSFVLWADGRPLVVDSGSFAYTGPDRERFRSTAAHNTVQVDGADQCVFWGDFRAGLLPRVVARAAETRDGAVILHAAHDGYRRLDDPVRHVRTLVWLGRIGLVVVDRLLAQRDHPIESRIHLAPGTPLDGPRRAGPFSVAPLGDGMGVEVAEGQHSPWLGARSTAPLLELGGTARPEEPFGWALLREPWRITALHPEQVALARDRDQLVIPLPRDWPGDRI